jgi:hypothetical protein
MTTVVLNTTTRKVEVFSSARDVQARAEIAALADVARSGDAADVNYTPPGAGAVARTTAGLFGEHVRITDYGGVGDDATDNTAAAANARPAAGTNRPIVLNNGDYNVSQTPNLYPKGGSLYKDALGTQWLVGTPSAPASRYEPVLWIEKISASIRDASDPDLEKAWDQGAIYASLEMRGGSAFNAAITGYALASGTSAQSVGVHARARLTNPNGTIYGLWASADVSSAATSGGTRAHGAEINVSNKTGIDFGWVEGTPSPPDILIGLNVITADGTNPGRAQHGILVQASSGDGFYTGLLFDSNSICDDSAGNAEAIRIRGGANSARRYTGLKLYDGHLRTGIHLSGPTYHNDVAIVMPEDGRIAFGSDTTATKHFTYRSVPASWYLANTTTASMLRLGRLHAHTSAALLGQLGYRGWNSSSAETEFARIEGFSINNTAGSEVGEVRVFTVVTGTADQQMGIRNGVKIGDPTGSFKGTGTLNLAGDIYKNNTAYSNPDYVFEHAYRGSVETFADRPGARDYQGLMPLSELRRYTREHLRLPGISQSAMGIFQRGDVALEKIEELALYLMQINERLERLEART